jgi:murein endopeptidase
MSRQISHASHGIALDLDIRTQHLPDERLQSTQRDNKQLVLG